jgi:peptidylprolyl isomerase
MRRLTFVLCLAVTAGAAVPGAQRTQQASAPAAASPVMVIDTLKGSIEIQLFPADAPKSLSHIIALVNRSFYRSQRFHRVEPSVIQFGDPQTRDMTKMKYWGTGNSYTPIGVAEISKRRFVRGVVGLAHSGDPKQADSQIFILKTANLSLNGKYAAIGQVTRGMEVVDKIEKADMLKLVTIKEAVRK